MNPLAALLEVYQNWRELTLMEGEAIRSGQWIKVGEYQGAKQKLQSAIIRFSDALQAEFANMGMRRAEIERQIRSVISELIELESRNALFVAEQKELALQEEAALNQSNSNLRRIQRSYGRTAEAAWCSFS